MPPILQLAISIFSVIPRTSAQGLHTIISALAFENTSSMYKDFQKGNRTEIDSLTSYVISEGKELVVAALTYEKLYKELKEKSK